MSHTASQSRLRSADIILVAFLGTVVMLFASFTSAYLIRRAGTDWTAVALPPIVWVNTTLLFISSVTLETACRRRNQAWLSVSLAMGLAFLAGQLFAWRQLTADGYGLGSNAHASFFYILSAVHGLHLLGGLGAMLRVRLRNASWRVSANYWHFMGVVWIYVLVLLLAL